MDRETSQAMGVSYEQLGKGVEIAVTEAFAFGTDALLLSRFAAPKPKETAIDLCSGCGIVPLRWFGAGTPPRSVYAVEIRPEAAPLMERSAHNSGLGECFFPVIADLRQPDSLPRRGDFDLVTCNPPYGRAGAGRPAGSEEGQIARHEQSCTFEEVTAAAEKLLRHGGRFCFCHPPRRLAELIETLCRYRLEPKRMRLAQRRPGSEPWLALIEAVKGGRPSLRMEPVWLMEDFEGNSIADTAEAGGDFRVTAHG